MHVIARPVHHHRLAFHAADGSCEIRKEFRPDFAAEIRLPLLGAEDRVNEDAGVGVGHVMPPLPGLDVLWRTLSHGWFAVGYITPPLPGLKLALMGNAPGGSSRYV